MAVLSEGSVELDGVTISVTKALEQHELKFDSLLVMKWIVSAA